MPENSRLVTREICGRRYEVGFWNVEPAICTIRKIESDMEPIDGPGEKMPGLEDWPDTGIPPVPRTEFERHIDAARAWALEGLRDIESARHRNGNWT